MTLEEWDRQLKGLSLEEYDHEITRWLQRERLKTACEVAGWVVLLVLMGLLSWLFLAATPNQCSAECEILRAEMEAQGK